MPWEWEPFLFKNPTKPEAQLLQVHIGTFCNTQVYKIGSYLLPLFGTCYRFLYVRAVPHLHYEIVKQVSVLRQGGADWRAR